MKRTLLLFFAAGLLTVSAQAQLSKNPDKFLGNITTRGQVDYGNEPYYTLWNQITPENESKWDACEPQRGVFTFGGADRAFDYAKQHGFTYKFHTLIWGGQYPRWMNDISTSEQTVAIEEWFDGVKAHYPDLPMIDVVNEAVAGHNPAPYKNALGGDGVTGYDWIIKAFEMAHERWPDAILIYNDYNTFRWQKDQFIDLVKTLRDAGAPIDAYGCQSHDLTDISFEEFTAACDEIQRELKMPMYSTEYDIGTTDDAQQEQQYQTQIPYMWEKDYCAGITLWGYIYGATWTTDGNSGLIKDGEDRPAMTWLRQYMASEKAQKAKSPFPGMVKESSTYVKCWPIKATVNEPVTISGKARLKTKTISRIDVYIDGTLSKSFTTNNFEFAYTPDHTGRYNVKTVVTATDGSTYERMSGFNTFPPRTPYNGVAELPGTLEAEDFDQGAEGISYHDSDNQDEGKVNYRSDEGCGVDIVRGNNSYAIGYTSSGEWLEYTVNVKEAGVYEYDAFVSSGATNSSFNLSLNENGSLVALTNNIVIPCLQQNNWDVYSTMHGRLLIPLEAGEHIFRINITGSSCNIDKLVFNRIEVDDNINIAVSSNPNPGVISENATIHVDASSSTASISKVMLYRDDVLVTTFTSQPYDYSYVPNQKGTFKFNAVAVDNKGKYSKVAEYQFVVNNKRIPHKGTATLPGMIEVEDFDSGGEDFTYHDSDAEDEGNTRYRNDNGGVDIVTGNNSYALGYTAAGEWTEYTVNVTKAGLYNYEAYVSSGLDGSGFSLALVQNGTLVPLARINVPKTGEGSWDTYKAVMGTFTNEIPEGQQIIRLTINNPYCNIDKVVFYHTSGINQLTNDDDTNAPAYNIMGVKVNSDYKGIIIKNGKKYIRR